MDCCQFRIASCLQNEFLDKNETQKPFPYHWLDRFLLHWLVSKVYLAPRRFGCNLELVILGTYIKEK